MPNLGTFVPSLASLTVYVVSFLGLLPFICKDMRYSLYFRSPFHNSSVEMAYHLRQNDLRVTAASKFWDSLHQRNLTLGFSNPAKDQLNVDIDVMIISASRQSPLLVRNNPRFLTQILWQFVVILNSTETRSLPWKIRLSVCDVDDKGHEEAKGFSSTVHYYKRFSVEAQNLPQVNIKEKEKQDYAFCLEESLKTKPKFVLLVEDDAFPHPQLFEILYYVLETRKKAMESRVSTSNVLFYKLYHPERLLGFWSLEPERIPQLVSFAVFFGSCVTLLLNFVMLCMRGRWKRKSSIHIIWFWAIAYFLLMAISISRQHIIEMQYISKRFFTVSPTPSCCTPGMLFVADEAKQWLHYMKNHICSQTYGKDKMLDDYRQRHHVKGLIVQPNLFVHIGFFSTLSRKFLHPSLMYYQSWFKLY